MKKVLILIFCLILTVTCTACSDEQSSTPTYETTPSGYMLTPNVPCYIEDILTYEVVVYDGELTEVIDVAENHVKKWWNDDTTFSCPKIVWINLIEGDVRGFQKDDYIFLDINCTRDDLLATVVHEWLHYLVPENTLIDGNTGYGRPLMEMVVEAITIDILKDVVEIQPANSYLYFEENFELSRKKSELVEAFRNGETIEAYYRIFGNKEKADEILRKVYMYQGS